MKSQVLFALFHLMTPLITAVLLPSSSVSMCSGSNLTNSETTEHLINLEFDQNHVEDRRNSYRLIIHTNDESPYQNSRIFLQAIHSLENPIRVFAIKANGQKEKIERNFEPKLFEGYLISYYDDQQQEQSEIPVQAMGTLNSSRNEISLVITAKSFYIAPTLSKSNVTNHHFHTILRTKDPANSFQMVHFDAIPKLIQPATFQRRTYRRDTKNKRIVEESGPKKKYCSIKFNIHYDMYEKFGKNINLIAQHAQYMMQFANQIFWSHKWTRSGNLDGPNSQILENYGIILYELNVETEPTYHDTNNSAQIINNFSDPDVCLVHNFTTVAMFYLDRKINGLSYVKSIFNDRNMGISSFYFCDNFFDYYCILSFVHELGHSFGSPHDSDGLDCLPSNDGNGSFIMNEPFMAEFGPNNFRFSPCSIRSIYVGIKDCKSKFVEFVSNKSHFRDPICGNYVLEGDEKCDEGGEGKCCDATCNIKTGASCSPTQADALCCDEQTCKPKSRNKHCLIEDLRLCLNFSVCDGLSVSCPDRQHLADNTSCNNGGYCFGGKCQMCQSCDCPWIQCSLCCWDENQRTCLPHAHKPDYTSCSFNDQKSTHEIIQTAGQCIKGECVKWSPNPLNPNQKTDDKQEEDRGISLTTIFIFVLACSLVLILAMYVTYHLKKWASSASDQNDGSHGLIQQAGQDES